MASQDTLPVDEVIESLIDHVRLTKEQLVTTWGLSDEEYLALQQRKWEMGSPTMTLS